MHRNSIRKETKKKFKIITIFSKFNAGIKLQIEEAQMKPDKRYVKISTFRHYHNQNTKIKKKTF